MKKILILIAFYISIQDLHAQDVIVKNDGSTILSKVLEVNTSDIKYKKHSNQNGPTYTISKSEIMSINYENGDKDTFRNTDSRLSQTPQVSNNSSFPRLIQKIAAENNERLIESYKTRITQIKDVNKNNNAPYCNVYFGVTQNSILSNEDLEISFVLTDKQFSRDFDIVIKNKSERIIYIDKGNCFRVINEVTPYCYYNAVEQTTVGRNSSGGASLGLGSVAGVLGVGGVAGQLANGVSVGGGTSHSSSTTYVEQRVIAIPPHSKKKLCENKDIKVSGVWYKTIDPNEDFRTYFHGDRTDGAWSRYYTNKVCSAQFGLYKGDVKIGQVLTYSESNSPHRREYILTYSQEENFNTYTTVHFSLYIQQIIGVKYWSDKGIDNVDLRYDNPIYCTYVDLDKR